MSRGPIMTIRSDLSALPILVIASMFAGCNTSDYEADYAAATEQYLNSDPRPKKEAGKVNTESGGFLGFLGLGNADAGGEKLPPGLDRNKLAEKLAGSWVHTNVSDPLPDGTVDRISYKYEFVYSPTTYKHGTFKYYTKRDVDPDFVQSQEGDWTVLPQSIEEERQGYTAKVEIYSMNDGPTADLFNNQNPYLFSEIRSASFKNNGIGVTWDYVKVE